MKRLLREGWLAMIGLVLLVLCIPLAVIAALVGAWVAFAAILISAGVFAFWSVVILKTLRREHSQR